MRPLGTIADVPLRPAVVELVVSDMGRALAFYRLVGLELPESADGEVHVEAGFGGIRIAFDLVSTIQSYNPSWVPPGPGGHRVALAFECDTPPEVDEVYGRLTGAGYHGHLEPWDAFWGMRYAVVHDPDGTPVDLFAHLPA